MERIIVGVDPFQSLNWDGVISNQMALDMAFAIGKVSIPQLGWGDFKRRSAGRHAAGKMFQSLNWDGVISNRRCPRRAVLARWSFNPSIGMG